MRMYDIIKKKRDGAVLSEEEIRAFVSGYTRGEIPDYQAAALCMAIYFRGMTMDETTALTLAIRDSGRRLSFSHIDGIRVDKHSTGGVGDKTSLVVAPIVASCGVKIAKMSGRGLGHTGGTIDKLESITGFQADLDTATFERIVNEVGLAIVGQSAELAPADKLLYALRDVTATVDSMPLIASSIMGKKLAADDDCIVLDVKTGSGSFMKSPEESRRLAEIMVEIGRRAGKKMLALITDMDRPLGYAIGNALEVTEAIDTLCGHGPADLTELCTVLAAHMLELAEKGDYTTCQAMVRQAIRSGSAQRTFAAMVQAQGGNPDWIYHPAQFPQATYQQTVIAPQDGYIVHMDTEGYGIASLLLGAGRNRKEDIIDYTAGIRLLKKTGDPVRRGEPFALLYSNDKSRMAAATEKLLSSTVIGPAASIPQPLILFEVR